MKKTINAINRRLMALLAVALATSVVFAPCPASGDDNSLSTSGSLTINGLSSANGLYAMATGEISKDVAFAAVQSLSISGAFTLAKISGGSVTLNVWKLTKGAEGEGIASYSGNDRVVFGVVISDSPDRNGKSKGLGQVTVNFSGGKATGTATLVMLP